MLKQCTLDYFFDKLSFGRLTFHELLWHQTISRYVVRFLFVLNKRAEKVLTRMGAVI